MKYYELVTRIHSKITKSDFESLGEVANYLDALEQETSAVYTLIKFIRSALRNHLELEHPARLEIDKALAQYENSRDKAAKQIDDFGG